MYLLILDTVNSHLIIIKYYNRCAYYDVYYDIINEIPRFLAGNNKKEEKLTLVDKLYLNIKDPGYTFLRKNRPSSSVVLNL